MTLSTLMSLLVLALAVAGLVILLVKLFRRLRPGAPSDPGPDPLQPLPEVDDLSVSGDMVRVVFAVPMAGDDPILAELLSYYALETVRRSRATLPLGELRGVEVLVSHRGGARRVDVVLFDEPGRLPEDVPVPEIAKLSEVMDDPLDSDFKASKPRALTEHGSGEKLAPLSSFLKISNKAAAALRVQGIDPDNMTAGELVRGILALRGYTISAGPDAHTHHAQKGSATILVREVPHTPGGYPELEDDDLHRFVMDMARTKMAKGMLVTEKYGPFSVYNLERRDRRMRFVTRERLQKAIDALALG